MLVAEFKWLLGKLPAGDKNRDRIVSAYGGEIDSARSDGKTIDLFSDDKYTLPGLLSSMDCPVFPADRRVPYPPGALLDMPRPLTAEEGGLPMTLDGNGKPSHIATTRPMNDGMMGKGTPGANSEMAAFRTFQERPEGRDVTYEDWIFVTEAYRPKEVLQQTVQNEVMKEQDDGEGDDVNLGVLPSAAAPASGDGASG